jgi:hypothetical protein
MPPLVRDNVNAFSSGGPFTGFGEGDFKAYEPKKWSSNAYTLERRKAKDKLLALSRAVQEQLQKELAGLDLVGSDEAPTVANGKKVEAQWAFFVRDAESRAALKPFLETTDLQAGANLFDIALQHQHAVLALRLDLAGLDLRVDVAGKAKVDRENFAEKLKQGWARDQWAELCRGLPEGAKTGFEPNLKLAAEITPSDAEELPEPMSKGDASFVVGTRVEKTDPILGNEGLIDVLLERTRKMLTIYRFLAWSRDNDHRQLKEALKKTQEEKAKRAAAFQPGDRVTILAGLFAGRSGYLAELDAKGRAKVMVGPVSVSVEAKDLKPGS